MTLRAICTLALVATALAAPGCRSAVKPATPPGAESDLGAAIEELRFRIAGSPRDLSARLGLARLELRAQRPGAALRHYLVVADAATLGRADREALAALLVTRAEARVGLGDGDARDDLQRASALDPEVSISGELRHEAAAANVLAALRTMDMDRARARLEELAPEDPRRAFADPDGAALPALAEAARWAWDGGARRAALASLVRYRERGGGEPDLLRRYAEARAWWTGPEGLDYLARNDLATRGVELCAIALRVDELGCALSVAAADPDRALELDRRARALQWRSADVAWVRIAMAGWVAGEHPGWLTEVLARTVPATTAVDITQAGAATMTRLGGDGARADDVLRSQLRRTDQWSPADRAVLIAEAALAAREDDIDALLSAGTVDDGWIAALRGADASGNPSRLRMLVGGAPAAARERFLRDRGALIALQTRADRERAARWLAIVGQLGYAPAARRLAEALGAELPRPRGAPLGSVAVPGEPALDALARAYERDPSMADRLAGDYADGAPAIAERGPAIASLFARLGDPARALDWWEAVARSSPHHPRYQLALAQAAAAAGDPTRAMVHATRAASRSGDAGMTYRTMTRTLLAHDAPAEAMLAARSALSLSAPAERVEVLALVERAAQALGRGDEAEAARGARDAIVHGGPREAGAAAATVAVAVPLEGAWAPDRVEELTAAAAWNPFDLEVRRRLLLRHLGPDDPRFGDRVAELVGMALDDRFADRQRDALELLAEALERAGNTAAAEQARAEARTIR
ncbi:MAG TPA: hypothetical protein VML75_28155 [Kofleriaceae bacterium]|nr:hypothetical protein [Kofleriaceae bacterium]